MNTIRYIQIKKWLNRYGVKNYTINEDGTIDVDDLVWLRDQKITEFPDYIQFNLISGRL